MFIGIDSGGTKTECWLGDETRVLGHASGESIKLTRVGQEVAGQRLAGLLHAAAAEAGVSLGEVTRTCVGMSGYSIARLREWMRDALAGLLAGEIEVCGDEEIALDAAFRGGPGILVIAGTGSIAVGRSEDGTRFTAGGWGPAIGDEGSGWWIGAEALRAGFAALDRGVDTRLLEAVRVAWGAADYAEVVGLAHAQPVPDLAALTPAVVRVAQEGDAVAQGVLRRGGEALADQVGMVWRRIAAKGMLTAEVACAGSVLEHIAPVRQAMQARLEVELGLRSGSVRPADGALWRARRSRSAP